MAQNETLPTPKTQSKRTDVLGYTSLIEMISMETGLKKAQVRKVLEVGQRFIAIFLRQNVGGRVHLGRLATFYSRMTKERTVNHPQQPGETLISPAHVVMRLDVGSRAKDYLRGNSETWDAPAEE